MKIFGIMIFWMLRLRLFSQDFYSTRYQACFEKNVDRPDDLYTIQEVLPCKLQVDLTKNTIVLNYYKHNIFYEFKIVEKRGNKIDKVYEFMTDQNTHLISILRGSIIPLNFGILEVIPM